MSPFNPVGKRGNLRAYTAKASDLARMGLRLEDGWKGLFTRNQASKAWPNGTRVLKISSSDGDAHQDGMMGTILGSISDPEVWAGAICYFVEFDDNPRTAIATMSFRLERAQ